MVANRHELAMRGRSRRTRNVEDVIERGEGGGGGEVARAEARAGGLAVAVVDEVRGVLLVGEGGRAAALAELALVVAELGEPGAHVGERIDSVEDGPVVAEARPARELVDAHEHALAVDATVVLPSPPMRLRSARCVAASERRARGVPSASVRASSDWPTCSSTSSATEAEAGGGSRRCVGRWARFQ